MFRKALTLTAIVLVFLVCEVQADVIHSTWVGGEQGGWGDASNWNPVIVPENGGGNTFAVTIDAGGDEVEVGLQQDRTISQLDCYGHVHLQQWTPYWTKLTVLDSNGLRNFGKLDFDELNIIGNVTNTAGAKLALEDVEIEGNLHNVSAGSIQVNWDAEVEDGTIENDGFIFVCNWADFWTDYQFYNAGWIRLYNGQCSTDDVFDNNDTGVIEGSGGIHADKLVRNQGTICASTGSLILQSSGSITNTGVLRNLAGATLHVVHIGAFATDVNNQGTIEVNAGGSITFDCNLVNEPNGIIKLLGGTLAATTITQTADANFAGFGGITGDVLIDPNGLIELTGPTNIVGDLTIDKNATLEISDGTTLITGHTTCNNGTIHMIGGRVICQGGLTNNNCHIIWEPGTYTNMADFNLDGTVNFKDFADFADTWLWQASWR